MSTKTKAKRKKKSGNKVNVRRHKFAMCAKKCRGSRDYRACMSTCLRG